MWLAPGPVFAYEWLTATRRWQLYAMRTGFLGLILAGSMIVWHEVVDSSGPNHAVSIQSLALYGESLYATIVWIELSILLLAAPAATAGAICLDKARGTLDHMLVTDLSNSELILGKLGARLVPVLSLIACIVPVSALGGLLGGIDPTALVGSFLTASGCAVLGCSLALMLSVWARNTHEALLTSYLLLTLWLVSPLVFLTTIAILWPTTPGLSVDQLTDWASKSNPYYLVAAPYANPGKVGLLSYLGFLTACLGISAGFLACATVRVRAVALKQVGRSAHLFGDRVFRFQTLAWLPHMLGPSLENHPVLWREWYRSRPSRLHYLLWLAYHALGMLWLVLTLRMLGTSGRMLDLVSIMNLVQVAVGLLLLSVSAATSLATERVIGNLDVLLTTPLSNRSILAGKWWSSFRQIRHVVMWPAILTGVLAIGSGNWINWVGFIGLVLAYGAAITSAGLALATWLKRPGRAAGLCVTAYFVFSIGWLLLVGMVFVRPRWIGVLLMIGSPLFGPLVATESLSPQGAILLEEGANPAILSVVFWIVVDSLLAVLLFAVTVATADRCLGRVSAASPLMTRSLRKRGLTGKAHARLKSTTAEVRG
jgi:ABC-type transport system involved in multi-copper enzyme maturation permease subunit